MIGELWTRARVWAFLRKNPCLEADVARNDIGKAIGVRAVYYHLSDREDAMGLSLKEPRRGSDAAILLSVLPDLDAWVAEIEQRFGARP